MISDERLEDIADEQLTERQLGLDSSEVVSMAKELLALRKALDGWQIVPIEPTEDMIAAGEAVDGGVYSIWKDMLTSAPELAELTHGNRWH